MEIFSSDLKQLSVSTEKGNVVLLLPIGIQLEEALEASMHFSGSLAKALELYKEKKDAEEKNNVSTEQS